MPGDLPETVRFLLRELSFPRKTTIVDVGANPVNVPPYADLLKSGNCRVVGFEPQPSAFAALLETKSGDEIYFPHAVGDGSPATLRICRSSGLTSIFEPDAAAMRLVGGPRWSKVEEEIAMETVALDALADLPGFDLMKIDIQGGENLVFAGAEKVLERAVCVIVELRYHRLYRNEPMMGGVDNELRRQGFTLHKFLSGTSRPLANSQKSRLRPRRVSDQLVDGDAVYIRDLTKIAAFADDQIAHLALLAAAVFQSHSLVLHLLDELVRRGRVAGDLPAAYVDAMPEALKAL
ncbi:FkbM family methyltransferase [Pseudogemmobacter humi]|uniref:Methyltransferase FkbM domain-containing protein n=1 Tax=Pseudogemmobacter humi TaxID=2483812 RepID=A0A3P5XP74_9RHOB|nr:FkbM family methyltransferase [Pseudogemmobacter humi]VDC30562.1 hypothetical protein XINFAN_02588 [Pseudogemmobacter humi]